MNTEFFEKMFCGPYLSTTNIVNMGGVYLITPVIQTGTLHILDVRHTVDLLADLNNPEHQNFWHTLSRHFGGFAYFIHYEPDQFCRLQLYEQFHKQYNLPKIYASDLHIV